MHPQVDKVFARATQWQPEGELLREILNACGLTEGFKWGKACYAVDDKNIAIIQRMKPHIAVMFFKGALLKDPTGVLKKPGANSRVGMRLEFSSLDAVVASRKVLEGFVKQAIKIEEQGLTVPKSTELVLVDELAARLKKDAKLRKAFEGLTPGRQREYNLQISGAKQATTRESRIDKFTPKILGGKGFRD